MIIDPDKEPNQIQIKKVANKNIDISYAIALVNVLNLVDVSIFPPFSILIFV